MDDIKWWYRVVNYDNGQLCVIRLGFTNIARSSTCNG